MHLRMTLSDLENWSTRVNFVSGGFLHVLPFSASTLLVGRQGGHPTCKKRLDVGFVGDDDLTGALHNL